MGGGLRLIGRQLDPPGEGIRPYLPRGLVLNPGQLYEGAKWIIAMECENCWKIMENPPSMLFPPNTVIVDFPAGHRLTSRRVAQTSAPQSLGRSSRDGGSAVPSWGRSCGSSRCAWRRGEEFSSTHSMRRSGLVALTCLGDPRGIS